MLLHIIVLGVVEQLQNQPAEVLVGLLLAHHDAHPVAHFACRFGESAAKQMHSNHEL